MNKIKLMSHLVAGYPTTELALTAARSLIKGGADILESSFHLATPAQTVLQFRRPAQKSWSVATRLQTDWPLLPRFILNSRKCRFIL